jgi:hypothetical protein
MLEPKGLELLSDSFKAFYAEIRSTNSTTIKDIVGKKLQKLGQKPSGLNLTIEEFVPEDFRVSSNLISRFGLSPLAARNICLQSLLDLVSVYARLAHMREFSCLMGVEEKEQIAWEMKVDSLVQTVTHEGANRQEQFIRVANIAGLGENQLLHGGSIDLDRLIELRQTDELILFKAWLRESGNKSEQEIRERVTSLRSKIGNKLVGTGGKMLRLMFTSLPSFIPDPVLSLSASLAFSSMDSFLFERIAPKDAVLGVLVKEYPAIFRK